MEFVDGVRVDQWFEANRASLRQRVQVLARTVEALAYAHGRLVVHGDLKTQMIFTEPMDTPRKS